MAKTVPSADHFEVWYPSQAKMNHRSMQLRLEGLKEMLTTHRALLATNEAARRATFEHLHLLVHVVGEGLKKQLSPSCEKYHTQIAEVMELGALVAAELTRKGLSLGYDKQGIQWGQHVEPFKQHFGR